MRELRRYSNGSRSGVIGAEPTRISKGLRILEGTFFSDAKESREENVTESWWGRKSLKEAAEKRILVVEPDQRYQRLLFMMLKEEGYLVTIADTGDEALALLHGGGFNLVLLAGMLPDTDGFKVLVTIREFSTVPVIIMSFRSNLLDLVKGLTLGAEDYITKPFSPLELVARIEAVLRRVRNPRAPIKETVLRSGDLEINLLNRQVSLKGQPLEFSPTEYRLLSCLASKPGAVLTHEDLLVKVWGENYKRATDLLRALVWRVRKKLEEIPTAPRYIITRPGVGYMLGNPA